MTKVFLSPSNQNENRYAYGNTNEMEQCGKIAQACKAALERNGISVMVMHDYNMSTKVQKANEWGADYYIPIHTNAFNGSVMGTRMFYYSEGEKGHQLTKAIFARLAPLTPGTSENIKQHLGLYELKYPNAWTSYIEVEFHDAPEGAKWIVEHTTDIGEAIAHGVCDHLGITFKESTAVVIPPVQPTPPAAKQLYRVRKSWENSKSQIGAFSILDNAKAACDKAGSGYFVFDESGKVIYPFAPYLVKVTADELNIRAGASTSYNIVGCIKDHGVYTIVDESNGFGKLKSGKGWISLGYTQKV